MRPIAGEGMLEFVERAGNFVPALVGAILALHRSASPDTSLLSAEPVLALASPTECFALEGVQTDTVASWLDGSFGNISCGVFNQMVLFAAGIVGIASVGAIMRLVLGKPAESAVEKSKAH